MKQIRFDFNNMFSFNIRKEHAVSPEELQRMGKVLKKAHLHLRDVIKNPTSRVNLGLEWVRLPYQDRRLIKTIATLGSHIATRYENVISIGIGGSYLGLKAAQDAFCGSYYNEFSKARGRRPRIFFEGNNLDPDTLGVLLKNLNPKKTFVIVISKSGETIEAKAAFAVVEQWLKDNIGAKYGRQIFAITDPASGSLRRRIINEQAKDIYSFRNLPLFKGVGGRYSEFNMGLLHLAIIGVNISEVLRGAREMAEKCSKISVYQNPAYLYAALQYILYKKKGKTISILMPFSQTLKSTGDWYVQLLSESLGKKYERKIKVIANGQEDWSDDLARIANVGRTPIVCSGTTDLHSVAQNNVEGENNKTITFIRVEKFRNNVKVPNTGDFISAKSFADLLNLAQEATEWSLVRAQRPNCTISLPEVSAYYWGGLLFFFEMAVAFEGELLNVNAFNQPGVEGYKNYMYYKLAKPGLPKRIKNEIKSKTLIKKEKFII
ncbi:MAG: hypothetical protein KJ593_03020 [Candidatus Omnitrophica bacterium]|nr:hypothetical protein [Candidatus Omnitrophota bacterium]